MVRADTEIAQTIQSFISTGGRTYGRRHFLYNSLLHVGQLVKTVKLSLYNNHTRYYMYTSF